MEPQTLHRLKTGGFSVLVAFLLLGCASPELVSFPASDGSTVQADLHGQGDRAVVLAPGGRFDKESWATQAEELARAGFRVLAIDYRETGREGGAHLDVLAAVGYLRETGASSVSVVGASFGGWAAARAAVAAPGEIDRLVLLAAPAAEPERLTGDKLFILARDDARGDEKIPRLPEIRRQFERAPEPKELVVLDGSAHAQFLFETEQGERLMREILRFLSEP